jgi:acyl-coenzyme A synthetase/AMP-(fatty) acid ligase
LNLDWLLENLAERGDADAVIDGSRAYSYRTLLAAIARWSTTFADHGIAGRVVSIEAEYGLEAVAAIIGAAIGGNILVPISMAVDAHRDMFLAMAEVEYRVTPSDGDRPVVATGREAAHPFYRALREAGTPGLVLFSSGTSGTPKAAVHDLGLLLQKFKVPRHAFRTLVFLQLDHIGGLNTLFYTLSNGGTVVIAESRMPREVCAAIARHRVQLLPTSPTFLNMLLLSEEHQRHDLSSLELITYGTEPMPAHTLERVHAAFPDTRLLQTYGLSELGILRSQSREPGSLWIRVGGEGFATKIVDGRLFVKAQSAMLGYLNAPSPFDEEGYFDTGDLVERDGDWLRILGRATEVINVGGNKVLPVEVENVLLAMENVADVEVHGEPSPIMGKIVVATVRLAHPEDPAAFKTRMRLFCQGRLPDYKMPTRVRFSDGLHSARFKKVRGSGSAAALEATGS